MSLWEQGNTQLLPRRDCGRQKGGRTGGRDKRFHKSQLSATREAQLGGGGSVLTGWRQRRRPLSPLNLMVWTSRGEGRGVIHLTAISESQQRCWCIELSCRAENAGKAGTPRAAPMRPFEVTEQSMRWRRAHHRQPGYSV